MRVRRILRGQTGSLTRAGSMEYWPWDGDLGKWVQVATANIVTHTAQNRMVYIQNLCAYLTPACFSHAVSQQLIANRGISHTRQYRLEHARITLPSLGFSMTGTLSGRVPPPYSRTWQ